MATNTKYWFTVKTHGWGWGPPATWQGWVVLLAFIGLIVLGIFVFRPEENLGIYLAFVGVLTVLLIVICWLKGEPPRWRWGRD